VRRLRHCKRITSSSSTSAHDCNRQKNDAESTPSTFRGQTNATPAPNAAAAVATTSDEDDKNVNIVQDDNDDENESSTELDFNDLMSYSSRRTSGTSRSASGSMALRAMSDSFNNSNDSTASFYVTEDSLVDNYDPTAEDDNDGTEADDNGLSICASSSSPATATTPRRRRKLPQRVGSGYVRDGVRSTGSRPVRQSSKCHGTMDGMAALRQKRRDNNASFTNLNTSMSQLPRRSGHAAKNDPDSS